MVSEKDAKAPASRTMTGSRCFNANGALTARAVVSQRVREGMALMYHAQEKIVNTPGSEITKLRGGIHNPVTRTVLEAHAHDRRLRASLLMASTTTAPSDRTAMSSSSCAR